MTGGYKETSSSEEYERARASAAQGLFGVPNVNLGVRLWLSLMED